MKDAKFQHSKQRPLGNHLKAGWEIGSTRPWFKGTKRQSLQSGLQVCRSAGLRVCESVSLRVCKSAGLQVCSLRLSHTGFKSPG